MNKTYNEGDLQVWHIPQVPGKAFHVGVDTPEEAYKIINILADYDSFQLRNNIKPDYSNVSGLQVFGDDGWVTWYNEDGFDLDEYMKFKKESVS